MNRNNLNWTDNRVLGAGGAAAPTAQSTAGVSPATYQAPANTGVSPAAYQPQNNTGVFPATYQPQNNTGVSPATYQPQNNTGVSPAAYQPQNNTGVSPASYQPQNNTGVSPATYQAPASTGVSPAAYQPLKNTGVSPAEYQEKNKTQNQMNPMWQDTGATPYSGVSAAQGAGMQAIPSEPSMTNETQPSLTRNSAYAPNPFLSEPGPPSVMDPGYVPGYLKTQIGKRVRAEFVFSNLYLDKTGILREVGYNYFVLEDNVTRAMIMCDLYSARFVTSI